MDKRDRQRQSLQSKKQRRAERARQARRQRLYRRLVWWGGGGAVAVLAIAGLVLFGLTRETLPPASFGPGHSESLPPRQINADPIPIPVQEHVMEHVGSAGSGVLVQYNCRGYSCQPDLVEKLKAVVESYSRRVFLAPFPGMDAKVALTTRGSLETLDGFEEQRIRRFIEGALTQ